MPAGDYIVIINTNREGVMAQFLLSALSDVPLQLSPPQEKRLLPPQVRMNERPSLNLNGEFLEQASPICVQDHLVFYYL